MTFTIGTISRCDGQAHYHVPVTVGGNTYTVETSVAELQAAAPEDFGEARGMVVQRIRSALLEANAGNWAQAQTALNGKTFKV